MTRCRSLSLALLALPLAACAAETRTPEPVKPAATVAASAPAPAAPATPVMPDLKALTLTTSASGLKWADTKVGEGPEVSAGATAVVHYSGWLEDGTSFDSSIPRGMPFPVKNVGKAGVIAGWNEGLIGMRAGGRRLLVIPGDLAYGPSGRPPRIPPNATLVFEVDLLEIQPPAPRPEPMDFPDLAQLKLTKNPSGLEWADVKVGTGKEVARGSNADMHYTGWLKDGSKFDSSLERGDTFPVQNVGNAQVIAGWNEGLQGMKEGGRRVLVIPGNLAYGERGFPGAIPPNATLVFMIDAVRVTPR